MLKSLKRAYSGGKYTHIFADGHLLYTGLRFDKEIKIIFKYRECLKVLIIVICKYKDLVVVWMLSFKETLF